MLSHGIAPLRLSRFWPARGPGRCGIGPPPPAAAVACALRLLRVRVAQVDLAHVFLRHPPAREHLHRLGDDRPQHRVQLVVGGRTDLDKGRHAIGAAPVHAVQHQAVRVELTLAADGEPRRHPAPAGAAGQGQARKSTEVVSAHGLKSCAAPQSPYMPPANVCPLAQGAQRVPVCGSDRRLRGGEIRRADVRSGS